MSEERKPTTPQAVLTEMLLQAQHMESIAIVAVYKDQKIRTAWSSCSQALRIGLIEALREESLEVWRKTEYEEQG